MSDGNDRRSGVVEVSVYEQVLKQQGPAPKGRPWFAWCYGAPVTWHSSQELARKAGNRRARRLSRDNPPTVFVMGPK